MLKLYQRKLREIVRNGLAAEGDNKAIKRATKQLRECARPHCLMVRDFDELDAEEQNKDTMPMNLMLKLIDEYGGLRIYRVN